MSAGRHPKSAVAAALEKARQAGFLIREDHKKHRWGWIACPACGKHVRIHGTPASPEVEGQRLLRFAEKHPAQCPGTRRRR